jgi:hypothetical protein
MLTKEQVQLPHCMRVDKLQYESGTEFIDRFERQAKTLETLGVPPSEAEKLTRIKEGLKRLEWCIT